MLELKKKFSKFIIMNISNKNTNSGGLKQKELESPTKLDVVLGISILEVAGKLGVEMVTSNCRTCINNYSEKRNSSSIEFNIRNNSYRCNCLNEKGDVVQLVRKTMNISNEEAIDWLFQNFIQKKL